MSHLLRAFEFLCRLVAWPVIKVMERDRHERSANDGFAEYPDDPGVDADEHAATCEACLASALTTTGHELRAESPTTPVSWDQLAGRMDRRS